MKAFFDTIRPTFGALSQSQVDGFNAIVSLTDGLPVRHQAYMLATVWHECAGTMQPITERGKKSYFDKYEPGTKIGKSLGNTVPGDGYRFRGRGFVQITGRANYHKASKVTGEDLLANPDLALRNDIAARIMMNGMLNGWFTGKKLSDYSDYRNMRRVINGVDKADLIAGYAELFQRALLARAQEAIKEPAKPVPAPKPPEVQKPTEPAQEPLKPAGSNLGKGAILALTALAATIAAFLGIGD